MIGIYITCISLFTGLCYVYILYPLMVGALARLHPKKWIRDENIFPTISILVPAYNEEDVIEKCLTSLFALEYPKDHIEIIIGSDGSTDRTNDIISRISKEYVNVISLCFPERRGKMLVVNDLAKAGQNEILFFTDADVHLSPNSLKLHVRHFADPTVGAVAGAYCVVVKSPNGIFESEKSLASTEQRLRENESLIHSTIGMFGGNYSIRKRLWMPMPSPLVYDDVYAALSLITRGFRVIFEFGSVAIDEHTRSLSVEFRRKARNASFGFATLRYFPELIGFRLGLVSVMLWSHKILRWLSPWVLVTIGILTLTEYFHHNNIFWQTLVYGECLVLATGLIGALSYWSGSRLTGFVNVFWFLSMQIAFMIGALRFITGSEAQAWVQPPRAKSSDIKEAVDIK